MKPELRASSVRLPAFAFSVGAVPELQIEEPAPESASARRVVGGELHEAERQGHATTIAAAARQRGAVAARHRTT
jgi:hypothetical protein